LLGHEIVKFIINQANPNARQSGGSALARRIKPARAELKRTAEILLIQIELSESSPAKQAK
jgi:hypothetical protein